MMHSYMSSSFSFFLSIIDRPRWTNKQITWVFLLNRYPPAFMMLGNQVASGGKAMIKKIVAAIMKIKGRADL